MNDQTVIEISSSPESSPFTARSRNNMISKGKTKSQTVPTSPIIDLTDSDHDERPLLIRSNYHKPHRVPVGSSSCANGSHLQPKVGGSSSIENIPTQHRKVITSRATPFFLSDDDENNPPNGVVPIPTSQVTEKLLPIIVDTVTDIEPLEQRQVTLNFPTKQSPAQDPNLTPESEYIARILEIIPDVEPEHLLALISQYTSEHQDAALVERVLHTLFEDPTYPKVDKNGKGKRKEVENDLDNEKGDVDDSHNMSPSKKPRINYAEKSRPFKGGAYYVGLALEQLQIDFPFIPKTYLRMSFVKNNSLYAPTHLFLLELDRQQEEQRSQNQAVLLPYNRRVTPFRSSTKDKRQDIKDAEFNAERTWLCEELKKQPESLVQTEEDDDENGIECGCCFTNYSFSKMVQCPETHLFCSSCMTTYASTLLGSHDPNITCMDQSGCKAAIPPSELRRFLPKKLIELWERVKQRKELEAAELEGWEECPFCEWGCVMENEDEKLFRCGNIDSCGVISCRKCKKSDHLPKSCKEVEEDKHLDGRHTIEEAMTRALMRNCPKCQKPFIKEAGCNKMTCPNCATSSCYVCRKIITGYEHFNQQSAGQAGPSNNPDVNKCLLWDSVEQRHADEVKLAAENALEEYKRDHPEIDDKEIKVDLPVVPPPTNPHTIQILNPILQAQNALNQVTAEVQRLQGEEIQHQARIREQQQDIKLLAETSVRMPHMAHAYTERSAEMVQALAQNKNAWYQLRLNLQHARAREAQAKTNLAVLRQQRAAPVWNANLNLFDAYPAALRAPRRIPVAVRRRALARK